ncbi:MAG TPA: type I DNA topoisomerase [candidate division WOR-3 bacterium]|uniref:DNA topoisomerase 1 n=1 Tax=candidate division WOR-3 bacterium TaxID=2052148 RepID=A0A7V0XF32_UNCW3|nr:type I DNA topoisomerase [candidate division WOR-3 bacterium]
MLIVESPAKARTIGRFLGREFTVLSSMGHVADLPRKGMAVDIEGGFEPEYIVSPEKKKTVAELRKAAKQAKRVWLATDEDREGEAIAWHLARLLELPTELTRRIVFHEITESAIKAAIAEPRGIDQHLVDAQQARRVLDRLVGYELSPVLWKKVRTGLSAGRVQSVAVRLVVEREREIDKFKPEVSFKTAGEFAAGEGRLAAKLDTDFPDEAAARAFLEAAAGAEFTVAAVEKKPAKRSPRPPFTTSTLQQEAYQKLGMSVRRTMALAQRLYEAGHITYMRTDSLTMADSALAQAAEVIAAEFGPDHARRRRYATKSKRAQEAHEAIRPTDFRKDKVTGEQDERKLYELIRRRALASQMADARVERTVVKVEVSTRPERFIAKGEVILFKGFLAVYDPGGDDEEDGRVLPPLERGQRLEPLEITSRESFSRPPARYTEASLVKRLEELGIGRPSTYAPTISTIQSRGYVERQSREGREREYRVLTLTEGKVGAETRTETTGTEKAKLFPTDVAGLVTDFLVENFREVVDYDFTARIETELDEVASGEKNWRETVGGFYRPFHADVEKAGELSRAEVARSRELGTDPATGKPVSARLGPYGPFVQLGTKDDDEKPKFASLRKGQRVETVTLDEALELLKLPRVVGRTAEGEEILANFGRFGPYVKYGTKYASIKDKDPRTITHKEALAAIAEAREQAAKRTIKEFPEAGVRVLLGRYGPYVIEGKKSATVPKGRDPAELTLEECRELIATAPAGRKKAARKASSGKRSPGGKKKK